MKEYTQIAGMKRSRPAVHRIKIGEPGEIVESKTGKQFRLPKKLDHFNITTRFRGPDGKFIRDEEFHKIVGDAPREIDVTLLYDSPSLNSPNKLNAFIGSVKYCFGDATEASRLDQDTGTYKSHPCPCALYLKPEAAEENRGKTPNQLVKCKPDMRLFVQLLASKNTSVGCAIFRTTSLESISNIITMEEEILLRTGGILAGIPLKLRMYPASESTPGGQTTNWKVFLDLPGGGWDEVIKAAQAQMNMRLSTRTDMAAIERSHRKALQTMMDDPDEADAILAELFPEQAAIAAGVPVETMDIPADALPVMEPEATNAPLEKEVKGEGAPVATPTDEPETHPNARTTPADAPENPETPPIKPEPIQGSLLKDEAPPDQDEVAFMEAEHEPVAEQAALSRLLVRKGISPDKLTKSVSVMDHRERASLLRWLLKHPEKSDKKK